MGILMDAENFFEKIQQPFAIKKKILIELAVRGDFHSLTLIFMLS